MEKLVSLLKSRRFWAVVSGVVALLAKQVDFPIDPETLQNYILLVAAWVIGDSLTKTETPEEEVRRESAIQRETARYQSGS